MILLINIIPYAICFKRMIVIRPPKLFKKSFLLFFPYTQKLTAQNSYIDVTWLEIKEKIKGKGRVTVKEENSKITTVLKHNFKRQNYKEKNPVNY